MTLLAHLITPLAVIRVMGQTLITVIGFGMNARRRRFKMLLLNEKRCPVPDPRTNPRGCGTKKRPPVVVSCVIPAVDCTSKLHACMRTTMNMRSLTRIGYRIPGIDTDQLPSAAQRRSAFSEPSRLRSPHPHLCLTFDTAYSTVLYHHCSNTRAYTCCA
jgi:hypothetical protein